MFFFALKNISDIEKTYTNTASVTTNEETTDSNGNVKIEAGAFVKDLTKSDQAGLYNYS